MSNKGAELTALSDIKADNDMIKKNEVLTPVSISAPKDGGMQADEEKRVLTLRDKQGKEYTLSLEYIDEYGMGWSYDNKPIQSLFDGNYDIF